MGPMDFAITGLEQAKTFYERDLTALTEDQILCSAGGAARAPVDFTYEVARINLTFAARLRSQEPEPGPEGDGWEMAPDHLKSKEAILELFSTAIQELLDAARAIPEDQIDKMVGSPGRERPTYALVNFAGMHTMYHDAQLNIIQCLAGDSKMHWFGD